jgi:hypothetical protein
VAAGAALALAAGCATGPRSFVPASSEEARRVLARWDEFRRGALSPGAMELFYDARISRHGLSIRGELAVRDDPGRQLRLRVSGPMGAPVARADWDGTRAVAVIYDQKRGDRTVRSDGPEFGEVFGIPLSARELSLAFFGLPEEEAPGGLAVSRDRARLLWRGGDLFCDFDLGRGSPDRIVARSPGRRVEIRYLSWNGSLPSGIRADASPGGRAELSLRTAAAVEAP